MQSYQKSLKIQSLEDSSKKIKLLIDLVLIAESGDKKGIPG